MQDAAGHAVTGMRSCVIILIRLMKIALALSVTPCKRGQAPVLAMVVSSLWKYSYMQAAVASTAQVDSFQQRKQQELADLSSQLTKMQANISSTEQLLCRVLAQQTTAASAALADVQASEAAAADEMSQVLRAAAVSTAAALRALTSSLQAQGSQLATFAKEQEEAVQTAQQLAAAGFTKAKQSVLDIGSGTKTIRNIAEATTAAARDSLSMFAADFEASMAANQEQLLAQVSSLLTGFVQDRKAAVAGMVQSVQQQLGDGRRQLAAATAELAAAADGCITALEVSTVTCILQCHSMCYQSSLCHVSTTAQQSSLEDCLVSDKVCPSIKSNLRRPHL